MKTIHIRYLKRQEIDPVKWDACIDQAPNGLIYAYSFYLDNMAPRWDALVLNDYEAVMPLTWNRKFGLAYLYQPYFTPALGVFGGTNFYGGRYEETVSAFLRAIPRKFKYWDIDLNETNSIGRNNTGLPLKETNRVNYLLPLNRPYEDIRQGYKRLATRMSRKAIDEGMQVIRQVDPAEVIGYYKKEYPGQIHKKSDNIYERLTLAAGIALREGMAATYLARWPDQEVGAFYLVLSDRNFVYSVIGGSTPKGKAGGAFYLLTDAVIRDHAGTERTFRFEGSDIPGIAFFDRQFGPSMVHYPHLILNKLPFPANLFKK